MRFSSDQCYFYRVLHTHTPPHTHEVIEVQFRSVGFYTHTHTHMHTHAPSPPQTSRENILLGWKTLGSCFLSLLHCVFFLLSPGGFLGLEAELNSRYEFQGYS